MKVKILLICFLFISAIGFSQETISLKIENIPLKEVFKTIQKESGYRFFYSDDLVDIDKQINLTVKNKTIENIISELENQTNLTFSIKEDKLIVVVPIAEIQQAGTITGKVTSEADPLGLPGVNVVIKGTTIGVITNFDGEFLIEVPDKYVVLQFSFIGFETLDIPVSGKNVIDVVLKENTESIEEIVVTALNISKNKESLGYSITSVNSEEISTVKQNNPINSLAGKVAGLQISSAPSGVDGSSRVVLRGIS
jgi:hypothetical protein